MNKQDKERFQKEREATICKELFTAKFSEGDGLECLDFTQLNDMENVCKQVLKKIEPLQNKWAHILNKSRFADDI